MDKIMIDGRMIDSDVVIARMDDALREYMHANLSTLKIKSEQDFVDEYVKLHQQKFSEKFCIN